MAGKKKPFTRKPNIGKPFDKQGLLADLVRALSGVKMPFDKSLKMQEGGAVPSKFKGFSKLPEEVQMKMNPQAAKKYKNGGAVMSKRGGSFKGTR